ncbi:MAG TPA: TadE/TadG family type IV pilus assembly protein [Sphingomicrobium sp.]
MMKRRLLRHDSGASAVEFALVLPLFLFMLLGLIDVGRWIWTYNRAEKATQMGVRQAVVTNGASGTYDPKTNTFTGIYTSYLGSGGLTQGDLIPTGSFGKITCDNSSCTCATTPCPGTLTRNATEFSDIVTRMQKFLPTIAATNVKVEYSTSGLGYVGNPTGADLAPLVTVRLQGLTFTPTLCLFFGCTLGLPELHSSLTFEDGRGQQSN